MLTEARMLEMLVLQEQLEVKISGPDWREQGNDYGLCIYMEANEMIDHHGWKHWKAHKPDYDAIRLELVDIWHFTLAMLLQGNPSKLADQLAKEVTKEINTGSMAFIEQHEELMNHTFISSCIALADKAVHDTQISLLPFFRCCAEVDMDFDLLYKLYVGKNVLNHFRQAHGYAEGTYIKMWGDLEDNEHLYALINKLGPETTQRSLEIGLETIYDRVLMGVAVELAI